MIYKIVLKAFFAIIKKSGKNSSYESFVITQENKHANMQSVFYLENFNPKLLEPEAFSSVEILLLSRDKRENKKFNLNSKYAEKDYSDISSK